VTHKSSHVTSSTGTSCCRRGPGHTSALIMGGVAAVSSPPARRNRSMATWTWLCAVLAVVALARLTEGRPMQRVEIEQDDDAAVDQVEGGPPLPVTNSTVGRLNNQFAIHVLKASGTLHACAPLQSTLSRARVAGDSRVWGQHILGVNSNFAHISCVHPSHAGVYTPNPTYELVP
jgi:hypothetical protein